MIVQIDDNIVSDLIGNKAESLQLMKQNGFHVPNGFILDKNTFIEIIKYNELQEKIQKLLKNLTNENIKQVSKELCSLVEKIVIPEAISEEISTHFLPNTKYAVRSSGMKEDLDSFSFAGQYDTFLNIEGRSEILKAILNCYKSMYSEGILSYCLDNNVSFDNYAMSVIIQEMVNSQKSGVAFTINPLTGIDKEFLIEIAEGLGENLVSGKVVPEDYIYNWYEKQFQYDAANKLLNRSELEELSSILLEIQMFFGYPVDVEFAYEDGKLYILQARAITKIMYHEIKDQWSTADFKDGGVSATVCYQFMWSLYEYIWENAYRDFLNKGVLISKSKIGKLGNMFFGRPYWNLTITKVGMSKVPGYKEIDFDTELGVKITYEGDGDTTKLTPISLLNALRIFIAHRKMTNSRLRNNEEYQNSLLSIYNEWFEKKENGFNLQELEAAWKELVFTHYFKSESTYFNQIFINTVAQSIYKSDLTKYLSESDYLNLMIGLNDISHLRPFNDIWNISRKIRKDTKSYSFWSEKSIDDIKNEYNNKTEKYFIPELIKNIEKFGYHSDKELDVTYQHYLEDPTPVIISLKETVGIDDENSPIIEQQKQKSIYKEELAKLEKTVKKSKYNSLLKVTEEMRKMLWWREEFRDISTKFYFLIRLYTLKLAAQYFEARIIDDVKDIWYLKIEDLKNFIDKKISSNELQEIIEKNKKYYNSFRNFVSENEIGHVFDHSKVTAMKDNSLTGVGCNNGIVTGVARVVNDFSEIDKIQPDDILITKFTDTGWTSKFAILKGIVTEYGGILCHAAIVSREYGIPCIVCASNITKKIKDGSKITINGSTGEIIEVK